MLSFPSSRLPSQFLDDGNGDRDEMPSSKIPARAAEGDTNDSNDSILQDFGASSIKGISGRSIVTSAVRPLTPVENILTHLRVVGDQLIVEGDVVILETNNDPPSEVLDRLRRYKWELWTELTSLRLDFETASTADLKVVGARTYAEDPSTRILLLCYAIADQPVQTWRPCQPMPDDLLRALASGYRVIAHNYQFEYSIWHRHMVPLGWPEIPLPRWSCTSLRARLARIPAKLGAAAEALRLPCRKDAAGKAHMLRLARRAIREEAIPEEDYDRLNTYSARDVEVLRALDRRLPDLSPEERELFELDFLINARGMPLDLPAVHKLIRVRDAENRRLLQEFRNLTGGTLNSPNQVEALRAKLVELGVDLPNCQRETLEHWCEDNSDRDDLVAGLISVRLDFAHSSDSKLDRMIAVAGETGRVRDGFRLYGAHTGRWSGQGVQLQNLPKNTLPDTEATLVELLARADLLEAAVIDGMEPLPTSYDPTPDVGRLGATPSIKEQIAGCLRGLFKAPEDWTFVSVDLGQIESRVLCWLANQENMLTAYREGRDVYLLTAALFGSANRNLGKLFTLSAGFGASGRVMRDKASGFGVSLTTEDAYAKTEQWRQANPEIVRFWHELFRVLCYCADQPADQPPLIFGDKGIRVWRTPDTLYVQLPSGRRLLYNEPQLHLSDRGTPTLEVLLPKGDKAQLVGIWHGLATENVVQAVAFDILSHAMLQLHRDCVFLVGSIHDEIIALAPVELAGRVKDHMVKVMSKPPTWAPDLPLAADGFVNSRFLKPRG
jgi:DNA polymerase